ncbi:MAG: glycogen/starch synthase, partial [Candidatus Gastranaerophilales bacterium]|nr:glycogen/starch synthase [Candidatus Gastranaerophilales bacterium]
MKISSINVGMTNFAPTQKTNQNHVSPIVFTGKKEDDEKVMQALLVLAGYGKQQVGDISKKEISTKLDEIIAGNAPSQKNLSMVSGQVSDIKRNHSNPTLSKHGSYFHGVYLLEQKNVLNRNEGKYRRAIETIQNIGYEKLTSTKPLPPITKPNPTIWSITSEFAPIKEGGLGSVPPEIRNNAEKLGVNIPTFVPMYLNEGLSTFNQVGDKYTYLYKGRELPLEKMATVKMDVYKNGIPKSIPVSFFLHTDKDKEGNERQLVFVKADDYFDGTIYEANAKTEEPEKFAVFSKAVYEFAKLKMEGTKYPKDVVIENADALAQIKEPDAMILNDWQASPTAALMRYKAVMENAHKQLSDATTQKLKDMSVITIGHNVKYQGSTQNHNDFYQKKAVTSNILNT